MAKTNHKGRNKNEPYVMLHRGVTNSDAWKSLDGITRAGLIEIWTYHNGLNNGQISFSVRQMRSALKVSTGKAAKIFSDLQDRGFLVKRRGSSFDWKEGAGKAQATEWEITTERCDGQPAKRLYRTWKNQNAVHLEQPNGSPRETAAHNEVPETPSTVHPEKPIRPQSASKRFTSGNTSISHTGRDFLDVASDSFRVIEGGRK